MDSVEPGSVDPTMLSVMLQLLQGIFTSSL